MKKIFLTELAWVFLFVFLLFMLQNIPIYSYERLGLSESAITIAVWFLPFICGARVAWRINFGAWWLCCTYAFLIAISIAVYNLYIYIQNKPTDFPGWVGSIWLLMIFLAWALLIFLWGLYSVYFWRRHYQNKIRKLLQILLRTELHD